uniref:Adenosine 3'-phospho 5'-phosphosulfate transporter 1 n=1 Tax=Panagrolaimus sp. JU765 TaxID=591449 RepID=A0AC34QQ83_9BILA
MCILLLINHNFRLGFDGFADEFGPKKRVNKSGFSSHFFVQLNSLPRLMGELNKKYQDYGYYGQELESSIGFNPYDYWPFRLMGELNKKYQDYGYYGQELESSIGFNPYDYWPFRLTFIIFGYATIVLPTYLLIVWIRRKYSENNIRFERNIILKFLKLFAIGTPEASYHFFMGFLQERIITVGYPKRDNVLVVEPFGDAQFLVLINRIVALILCLLFFIRDYKNQPVHVPPLYKHSFCSLSNTLSSWCQYEALKFVSFPVMTVCKASKLIPTMLMGRIVRNKKYSTRSYSTAIILVFGACLFFLSTHSTSKKESSITTISGIVLMAGYLAFDSFTPNWQKKLFDCKPQVSKTQMMLGVNAFSAVLCFASLLEQGTLLPSMSFALTHDGFTRDVFLLSLSGALGQVFIYAIIKQFGPEVLAVIMTLRQILSIVVSSIYFSHPLSIRGIFGLLLVFGAIFYSKFAEIHDRTNKRNPKS